MAILGMRGTGSWTTGTERPLNWREKLLYLFPNSPAIFTMLVSKLGQEATTDPTFNWFEKGLPVYRQTMLANQANVADVALVLDNSVDTVPAQIFRAGYVVMNDRTMEVMWVSADPVTPWTTITVIRGKGSVAAAMLAGDGITIIGDAHAEGATVSKAIQFAPSNIYNYTGITRTPGSITRTAKKTRLRTGDAAKEIKRQCLEMHGIQMEWTSLFSSRVEDLTTFDEPARTPGGLNYFISTNIQDFSGSLDLDTWDDFLEQCSRQGSEERLLMAGGEALNNLNKMCRDKYTINATPKDQTYGMNLQTWETSYLRLQIKRHPLLALHPIFKNWAFMVDMKNIKYRYVDDTMWRESNIQASSENLLDAQNSEFLTEWGLEIWFESTHAIMKNISGFTP